MTTFFAIAQHVAITTDRNNTLYQEVENPISVAVENQSCKNLYITIDNGTITGSNGLYLCKPEKVGNASITVSVKKNGKLRRVGVVTYKVRHLINYYNTFFKVGPYGNGCSINKKVLQAQEYARAEPAWSNFDVRIRIDSFSVCIISSGKGTTQEIKNIGSQITPAVNAAFAALADGDMVLFKAIHVQMPDKRSIELNPVLMFVRE
jgi:archaellum component FlaG (FlaF/FlaG flagellin family)